MKNGHDVSKNRSWRVESLMESEIASTKAIQDREDMSEPLFSRSGGMLKWGSG
jgi:hypothetical protein